jgi:hypothetical protein
MGFGRVADALVVPYLLIQLIVYILESTIFLKYGVLARASIILTTPVEGSKRGKPLYIHVQYIKYRVQRISDSNRIDGPIIPWKGALCKS